MASSVADARADPPAAVRVSVGLGGVLLAAVAVWIALHDLAPNAFHPHGYCYLWDPTLVGIIAVSDTAIWLSYSAIGITLAYLVRKGRHAIPFGWVLLAFGAFIVTCGLTHLMDVVTLYKTTFWLAADLTLLTAIGSVATAIALPPIVPKVLRLLEAARLSEHRRVELEQAAKAAVAEEARFRTLLESAPDATITTGEDGRILLVNAQAETLFGYERRELIGQPVDLLLPERLRQVHTAHRHAFHSDPRRRPMGAGRDLVARRKDGTEFPAEISLSPFPSDQGLAVIVVVRDITVRWRAEQARAMLLRERAARAEAEAAGRAKDELLAVVSHELRTPLNAIIGWTSLLRSKALDEAAAARALEVIERNGYLQRQVVDDLLDVSGIMAGKIQLAIEEVDLRRILHAAVDSLRPTAEAKHLHLEIGIDSNLPSIPGDPNRLQQVFWNLLSNAVKFTPADGGIRLSATCAGARIRVQVADTGIGIDPAFLPHVFDRFRQRDSSMTRAYGGLGLGLALVREFVDLHGGTVEAQSAGEGHGTTFTVELPVSSPPSDERQPAGHRVPL